MTNYVDQNYFIDLANAEPGRICRNSRAIFNPEDRSYSITIWGERYLVDYQAKTINRVDYSSPHPHEYFNLFVIYYLLLSQDAKVTGEWVSEKDLPGGSTFFRGPHLIPTQLISGRFGNDLEGFKTCCMEMGGAPLDLADAAFRFEITNDIPIAVLYWQGDEDFPAEAGILYDRSMTSLLPLDIVFALAVDVCSRIGTSDRTG